MKRPYQIVTNPSKVTSLELAELLSKDGQLLLPLVELLPGMASSKVGSR